MRNASDSNVLPSHKKMLLKCPAQCRAITRKGQRCGITDKSSTKTNSGQLASYSLQLGRRECLFHLQLFVCTQALPLNPIVVYLDFETSGLDPLRDHIVEFGALSHACGATFSTVVRPLTLPSQSSAVHGISDEELEHGPPFRDVFDRFVKFLDDLLQTRVTDNDSSEEEDFETRLATDVEILLCGHNARNFDFPFLLSEALRNKLPVHCFGRWHFVDTLEVCRSMPEISSGCVKLQCLRKLTSIQEDLPSHRALEDCIVLQRVTGLCAESLGVKVERLLSLFAYSLDLDQTLLNLAAAL